MTSSTKRSVSISLAAGRAAVAWCNAFLATGDNVDRPVLYRTIAVEFFESGVQFVATSGHLLLRAWCPSQDDPGAEMPLTEEVPDTAVIVMDTDKFAIGFIKATLAACGATDDGDVMPLVLSVEPTDTTEPQLGEELASERLTLRAFGQELHCRLYEGEYPNWRGLHFGLDAAELVDGMCLAPRLFALIGKLKGVTGIDCDFHGAERAIEVKTRYGDASVRGLLMPMRRDKSTESGAPDADEDESDD